MSEKPILFNSEMVKAVLAGRKTQTRRVIKNLDLIQDWDVNDKSYGPFFEDEFGDCHETKVMCPYGQKGDQLWVRETFRYVCSDTKERKVREEILYKADGYTESKYIWKPSIFMPRWASRIQLEITDIRVERVQDISEKDAKNEGIIKEELGCDPDNFHPPGSYGYVSGLYPFPEGKIYVHAKEAFRELWNSINAKPKPKFRKKVLTHYESYPWSDADRDVREVINGVKHFCYPNPWVWVVEFKMI